MNITRTERLSEGLEFHNFGVADSKGRVIGCRIAYEVEVFEETILNTWGYWNNVPAGTYYSWTPSATRDGKDFGASQRTNRCATEEERFEQVAKYLKGAEARARKNAK